MKFLGGKKKQVEEKAESIPVRRQGRQNENYRIGRTIAGDAFSDERKAKLERLKQRKKTKRKNVSVVIGAVILIALIGIVVGHYVSELLAESKKKETVIQEPEPTVVISDDNPGTKISARVKEFVVRLEKDAKIEGFELDRVVLPLNKVREIHVYIKERGEYFKMTIDRGSAEQAEDMGRMIRYLDKKQVKAEYVDLRVEGKAYYK